MKILFFLLFISIYLALPAQDSIKVNSKKNRFIFDLNSGLIINNAISNFSRSENAGNLYWQTPGKPICFGYSGGADLMLGKNPYSKHFFCISYGLTNSSYADEYHFRPLMHYPVYKRDSLNYTKQYQTFDFSYGGSFRITNKITYTIFLSYSYIFKQVNNQTGYLVYESYSPWTGYQYDSTFYSNYKLPKSGDDQYLSLRNKLSYDFNIRESKFAAIIIGNLSLGYRLPWLMFGLQYYPFKKMC